MGSLSKTLSLAKLPRSQASDQAPRVSHHHRSPFTWLYSSILTQAHLLLGDFLIAQTKTSSHPWRTRRSTVLFHTCVPVASPAHGLHLYDCSLQWESMYINSFHLISVMGFVLDESAALYLLTAIPLSLHVYGFSPLLLILFFPSSIFHIWGSNYQILHFLHFKVCLFFFLIIKWVSAYCWMILKMCVGSGGCWRKWNPTTISCNIAVYLYTFWRKWR